MHVKFTCVNEIEAMYETPRLSRRVSVKVEISSTFMLTRERPYVAYARRITRQWKSTFTGTEVVPLKNRTTFFGRIYCLQFLSHVCMYFCFDTFCRRISTRQWKSTFTGTEFVAYNNRTAFRGRIYCLQILSYVYV